MNKYLDKVAAITDDQKQALKSTGKLGAAGLGIGLAGSAVGAYAARKFVGSKGGMKVAAGLKDVVTKAMKKPNKILKAIDPALHISAPSSAIVGAGLGAHAVGGLADYHILHHDFANYGDRTKQASSNKYLQRLKDIN